MIRTLTQLQFQPPLGTWLTAVIIAMATMATLWHYLRRKPAINQPWPTAFLALRVGALIGVAWLLAGPGFEQATIDRSRTIPVRILADSSASMNEPGVGPLGDRGHAEHDDTGDSRTRWQQVTTNWLSMSFLQQLRQHTTDVQLYRFDEQLHALDAAEAASLEPVGRATNLFGAIDRLLPKADSFTVSRPASPRGVVVVLSDGHDTQPAPDPSILTRAQQTGWRVVSVPVGLPRNQPDLAVHAWATSDTLLEGQSTSIEVALSQRGYTHREARVDLEHRGVQLESRIVALDDRSTYRLGFPITPLASPNQPVTLHDYQVRVTLVPQATTATRDTSCLDRSHEPFVDNNKRWVFVQVSRQRIRAALFEGQPYWDTTFLARVLRDDPQVDLTAIHHLGPGRSWTSRGSQHEAPLTSQQRPPIDDGSGAHASDAMGPQALTRSWLGGFDVVILGRSAEVFFGGDRAELLKHFVLEQGGALVLARGEPFDRSTVQGRLAHQQLSSVWPVAWGQDSVERLGLRLTDDGRVDPLVASDQLDLSQAVLTRLPDMLAATRVVDEKAASVVLLRQQPRSNGKAETPSPASADAGSRGMAALAHQNVGRGRVLAVLTQGMWRWAFLPASQQSDQSVYRVFWARAIRWLATSGPFLPGASISMRLDRLATKPGQPVAVTVVTRHVRSDDVTLELVLTDPLGHRQPISLTRASEASARYIATIQPRTPGVYQLDLTATGALADEAMFAATSPRATARLAVYDPSLEQLDVSAKPHVLASISQATGGWCLPMDQPEQLLDHLHDLQQARRGDAQFHSIADHPAVPIAIVLLLGIEWLLRRRVGLL